jgi:diguanylate cyclase (GGDEF)-like protein
MGRSIRIRIIGPVALLIVIGMLAAVWISVAALHSHRSTRGHNERAFETLRLVKNAGRAFTAADDFVANILEFNVLRHPSKVHAEFDAARAKLTARIASLKDNLDREEMIQSLDSLTKAIARWSAQASIAVGSDHSPQVPTRHLLKNLSADVITHISRIEAIAQGSATALAAGERERFTWQMISAFATIFAVFSIVAIIALGQAGWLARALTNILEAMHSIGYGRFDVEIPHRSRPDEVGAMARGVAKFAEVLRELTQAKEKIEHMALNDSLTGLANRRLLRDYLQSAMTRSATDGKHLALLHVDLDRFKQVNDFFGHAAGDAILCETANSMLENVRKEDLVARIGGDEFVVVIEMSDGCGDIGDLAQGIISRISRPVPIGTDTAQVGASIGIAFSQDANGDPERLLANADIALYEAKSMGRGCHCIYCAETRQRLEQNNSLILELKSAIARQEISVYFQPQIDGRNGKLLGLEALVRWHHPTKGVLSPGEFLDVAFENGLSDPISNIVLEKAIHALQFWRSRGLKVQQVSINLHAKQLRDDSFIETVMTSIERSDLSPADLAIEVLESVLVGDESDPVIANLGALQKLGFPIELDDFGTGHASISNLRKFKVDKVKIDRAFVTGVASNVDQEVMLRAIIELTHNLGIECIAEGVETESEKSKLLALGCAQMQGYGICRPMSFEAATQWIYLHCEDLPNGRARIIA